MSPWWSRTRYVSRRNEAMKRSLIGRYRRARRGVAVTGMAAVLLGVAAGGALADGYGKATQIGGNDYSYASSTYTVTYNKDLYQYETGKDGNAYYSYYDGSKWSDWQSYADQP